MSQYRRIMVLALIILATSFLISTPLCAVSFDSVFERINQMRTGNDIEVKVHVTSEYFIPLYSKNRRIDCNKLNVLLEKHEAQVPSQFKILPGNDLVLQYDLERNGILEQTWKEDKLESCNYIEYFQIETYSLNYWPRFLEEAVSNGLTNYKIVEDENSIYAVLTFSPTGPSTIEIGRRVIHLTDEVCDYMRINKDYNYWSGNKGDLVILIHEPHWDVIGQYKLIKGLKHLIDSNSKHKFRFLVEGLYSEDTKYISTEPLLNILSDEAPIPPQVLSLVRYSLIDGALAYRLLYNPQMPALAIDDPNEINNTPAEKHDPYLFTTIETLTNTFSRLHEYQSEKANEIKITVFMLLRYLRADRSELKGQHIIDYQSMIAELFENLAESLRSFDRSAFSSEISQFEEKSDAYKTDNVRYNCALKRDGTMADNISLHFDSSYKDRIPIVFIGNFHTPAIVSHLRSKGIGYLVLEPRTPMLASTRTIENFRNALNEGTRRYYLNEISSRLKLPVAPTMPELHYYEKFIHDIETPKISNRKNALRKAYHSLNNCKIDLESLCRVIESNGHLCGSNIFLGGGGIQPPSNFTGAFAAYSCEPEKDESKLVMYNHEDNGWTNQARYRCIQHFMAEQPFEKFSQNTREVWFYHDRESGNIFASYYDPISQRIYLLDGEYVDIFSLLPLPKVKDDKGYILHMQIGFWEILQKKESRTYG